MTKFLVTTFVWSLFSFTSLYQADAGPDDPVNIPDSGLRTAIEAKLGKSAGEIITETEMNGMTELYALNRSISNLTGLEHATGVTTLYLNSNDITDITPLKDLTALELLSLQENWFLSNISPLKHLVNLKDLHISSTSVTGLGLSEVFPLLSELELLSANFNPISDLSFLNKLPDDAQLDSLSLQNMWGSSQPVTEIGLLLKDISPLVEFVDAGKFIIDPPSWLSVSYNLNLDYESFYTHIPALFEKGVDVTYRPRDPSDSVAKDPEPGIESVSAKNAVGRPGTSYTFVVQAYNGMHNYYSRFGFGPPSPYYRNTNFEGVPVTWTVTDPDDTISEPEVVKTGNDGLSRFAVTFGSHGEKYTVDAVVPAQSNTDSGPSHAELRVSFTATAARDVPIVSGITVTFEDYPEKPPTDEFPLTIRFSEHVTGFEKEDVTIETELKTRTGTATLEALTPVEGPAQIYTASIGLPRRATGTVKLIVSDGTVISSISGNIGPAVDTASELIEFGKKGPSVFPSYVPMDKVIFNEFRNAENDTHDWIELKNISDKEVSLKEWEISIVASQGEHLNTDRDIVAFPDYTLPPDGILLIVNTDQSETDLIRGQNIQNPKHNSDLHPHYLIAPEMKLPNSPYLLILRSARDKNGKWEGFEDLAGDYHRGDVNYRTQIWPLRDTWVYTGTSARFSEGEVYQRVMRPKGAIPMKPSEHGYFQDAWVLSDYQSGLGYDPSAPPETSLGTPGYDVVIETEGVRGQISFSEVMFATNETTSLSQWIELYNNSSEKVDLEGWTLMIEVQDSQTAYHWTTFNFKPLEVLPNQTVLLVSRNARTSGNIPESRIYDIYRQNGDAFRLGEGANKILGAKGFALRLLSPDGMLVDMVGNLNGREGQDKPRWTLPMVWTETGARSSLIRVYEDGLPSQGNLPESWVRAADTALMGQYTYWGLPTDDGTPGYRQGSPLPVTLSSFRADRRDDSVIVKWSTASEMETAGFNILRSETRKGEFQVINPTLISGAGTTSERQSYDFTDTTAKPNVVYYYRIEDVSLDGVRQTLVTTRLKGEMSASGKLTTTWGTLKIQDYGRF